MAALVRRIQSALRVLDGIPPALRRLPVPFWVLMCVSGAQLQWLVADYWKPNWDSAIYISLARSLAAGQGYVYMGEHYGLHPPLFPLLLAPIEWLFGDSFWLMHLLIVSCALAAIACAWQFLRRGVSERTAYAVALLTAFSPEVYRQSSLVSSDVPFLLLSLLALLAAAGHRRDPERTPAGLVAAAVIAAAAMRELGCLLAVAAALRILSDRLLPLKRRVRSAAIILSATVAAGLLWKGYVVLSAPGSWREAFYHESMLLSGRGPAAAAQDPARSEPLSERWLSNARTYVDVLPSVVVAGPVPRRIARGVAGLVIFGWILALFRWRTEAELYVPLYMAVLLSIPLAPVSRYFLPVLPFLFAYALHPLLLAAQIHRRFRGSAAAEGILLTCVVGAAARLAGPEIIRRSNLAQSGYLRGGVDDLSELNRWAGANTQAESVLLVDNAPWAHLFSGRRTHSLRMLDPEAPNFGRNLRRLGISHLLVSRMDMPVSQKRFEKLGVLYPRCLTPLHQIGDARIFRLRAECLPDVKKPVL